MSDLPALDLGAPIGDGSLNLGGSLQDEASNLDGSAGREPLALDLAPPSGGSDEGALDLDSLDLGLGGDAPVALELPGDDAGDGSFGQVDLPTSSGGAGPDLGVVSFSKPAPALDVGGPPSRSAGPANNDMLQLADIDDGKKPSTRAASDHSATKTKTTKKKAKKKSEERKTFALTRTHKLVALGVVLLLALGGGGFYLYQKQQAAADVRSRANKLLERARKQLASDAPGHWDTAAQTAERALKIDGKHAVALGIAAQAHYAAFLDTGIGHDARVGKARAFVRTVTKNDLEGIDIDKAEALGEIAAGKSTDLINAVQTLRKVLSKLRGDADAQLYLGWAYAAQHNYSAALQSFGAALKKNPNRIPALYGQGLAYMALGERKKARATFGKVIQRDSSHVGAQIGNAQLLQLPSLADREQRYLEILQRKDIGKADPRSVSLAWSLAGDLALLAGRVDEAKQRYDQAAKLDRTNLRAAVGKAKAALKQNRLAAARDKLTRVLDANSANIEARLTLAAVELSDGKLDAAQAQIDKLEARKPPLEGNSELTRFYMTQGALAEARADANKKDVDPSKYDAALAFYEKAQKHAPKTDVRPIVARSAALQKAGRAVEAVGVLKNVESKAESEPALAVTLGLAHFNTKSFEKAEAWFRKALALKPDNVEAQFQLGLTLYARKQYEPAVTALRKAYDSDMAREDIGLQLAVILEELTRDKEAEALYLKLLAGKTPSLNVRARAGRFYVRKGRADQVTKLGQTILKESPGHPAGLFLRAESQYIKGNYADAVRYYKNAVRVDPAPQFLDGLGRAYEQLNPPLSYNQAMQAYRRAAKADDSYLSPRLGIARIYLTRLSTQTLADAIASLEDARRLDPKNAWVYYGLGACYRKKGNLVNEAKQRRRPNFDRALSYYRTALKFDAKRADVHWAIGDLYYELNRPREAARSFSRAVSLGESMAKEPNWLNDALFKWARSARAIRDRRGALKALEKLEGRDPRGAIVQEIKKMKLELRGGR